MKLSLRQRLLRYLQRTHGWVHSGELQRIVMKETSFMPRTTVRRLQELCEDNEIEVRYDKGSALYRARFSTMLQDERKDPETITVRGVGKLPSYEELEKQGLFA